MTDQSSNGMLAGLAGGVWLGAATIIGIGLAESGETALERLILLFIPVVVAVLLAYAFMKETA